jgi:hypothetical protein
VVPFALPADLAEQLERLALIGEHADQADPELEAFVQAVLRGYLAVTRHDLPLRPGSVRKTHRGPQA